MNNDAVGRRYAVCQLGGRMHYAVARALHEAGALDRFHTDAYLTRTAQRWLSILPSRLLPAGLARLLSRGSPLPAALVQAYPAFGFEYYLRTRNAAKSGKAGEVFLWAGRTFGARVLQHGFGHANAVYTFNTAALEIVTEARRRGIFTVVEQTIAPRAVEERLLAAERARHPDWETPTPVGAAAATAAREAHEWSLADLILCGSDFVRDGIRQLGGPVERCVVVPYGVDLAARPRPAERASGALRVLIVGHVSLRKGAPGALTVAQTLKGVAEFRWVGPVMVSDTAASKLRGAMELTGAVPRTEVAAHYDWADVLLLPSICEGSATVTYEALAAALPVVTTTAAGSPVRHGVDGLVADGGDTAAMIEYLRRLAEDRSMVSAFSANAAAGASRLSFNAYKARLLSVLTPTESQA